MTTGFRLGWLSGFAVLCGFVRRARAEIGELQVPQVPEAQQVTLSQAVGVLTLVTLAEAIGIIVEVVATHGFVAALGSGISTAATVGAAEGAVAAVAVTGVGLTIVLGTLLALGVIAIAANAVVNGPRGNAPGQSGEMTDDMAAANATYNGVQALTEALTAAGVTLSVNRSGGIDVEAGPNANGGQAAPSAPTLSLDVVLSSPNDSNAINPSEAGPPATPDMSQSGLPGIGESVDGPGLDAPGPGPDVSDGCCTGDTGVSAFMAVEDWGDGGALPEDAILVADHTAQPIPAPAALLLVLSIAALMAVGRRLGR